MLSTMLQCASRDAPLLVWACTITKEAEAMPAIEVANMLQLLQLTHPWKVSFDSTGKIVYLRIKCIFNLVKIH